MFAMDSRSRPFPTDPVIEAYKRDIDETLLIENLRRSPEERLSRMIAMLELVEELRRAREHAERQS